MDIVFKGPKLTGHLDNLTSTVVCIDNKYIELLVNTIEDNNTNAGLEVYFLNTSQLKDGFYTSRYYRFNKEENWGKIPKKYIPYAKELLKIHLERKD